MSGFAISGFLGLPSIRRTVPPSQATKLRPWRHSLSCASAKFAGWTQRLKRERAERRMWELAQTDPRVLADLWAMTTIKQYV